MPGEPTPGDAAALEALRVAALATKKTAANGDAAAALLAADPPAAPALPSVPPPTFPGPGIDLARLEQLMSRAIAKSNEGLRDGITAVTREDTSIKAPQARLESHWAQCSQGSGWSGGTQYIFARGAPDESSRQPPGKVQYFE